ncbi:MAG: hypothetical protein HY680_01205 [Chloroflexi bacterium]|nr:hypothetical protein [Chloroflexota bacterium]
MVKERLDILQQDLAYFRGRAEDRAKLERRVHMLAEEIRQLDEEEEERGTQWLDEKTGQAADM